MYRESLKTGPNADLDDARVSTYIPNNETPIEINHNHQHQIKKIDKENQETAGAVVKNSNQ